MEARQRLEIQQAEAAAALRASASRSSMLPPPLTAPPGPAPPLASEPSEGAMSLSAPVTLNDKQHRTAAALLASLGQTANRGRERLGRLERVLNTIAADAAEPQKVRQLPLLISHSIPVAKRQLFWCRVHQQHLNCWPRVLWSE